MDITDVIAGALVADDRVLGSFPGEVLTVVGVDQFMFDRFITFDTGEVRRVAVGTPMHKVV